MATTQHPVSPSRTRTRGEHISMRRNSGGATRAADHRVGVSIRDPGPDPDPVGGVEPGGDDQLEDASRLARTLARWPRRVVVAADLGAVALGLAGTYAVSRMVTTDAAVLAERGTYGVLMVAAMVSILAAFASQRLYTTRCIDRPAEELRRLFVGCALGAGGLWAVAFIAGVEVSRAWALMAPVAVFVLVALERWVLRSLFRQVRAKGGLRRDVVIVGRNAEATAIGELLDSDLTLGYRVLGTAELADPGGAGSTNGVPTEDLERIVATVRRSGATGVVLTTSALDLPSSNWLVRQLTDEGFQVELSSTLRDVASSRLTVRQLGRFPILYVQPTRRTGWRSVAKRSFDLAGSLALLVVGLPLMAAAAVAIKVSSPGPVLFRQERVGRDGRRFEVLKLRTMVVDAEAKLAEIRHLNQADGPLFKLDRDPRVTRVGSFLRSSSLDELPQLFNVLRGEMSLVGPRPALPSEVAEWSTELFGRLRVQPGITGMWQVSGRSDASFDDYVRLDLYYVDNWSLATDLSIMLQTVPAVLLRRGAR